MQLPGKFITVSSSRLRAPGTIFPCFGPVLVAVRSALLATPLNWSFTVYLWWMTEAWSCRRRSFILSNLFWKCPAKYFREVLCVASPNWSNSQDRLLLLLKPFLRRVSQIRILSLLASLRQPTKCRKNKHDHSPHHSTSKHLQPSSSSFSSLFCLRSAFLCPASSFHVIYPESLFVAPFGSYSTQY